MPQPLPFSSPQAKKPAKTLKFLLVKIGLLSLSFAQLRALKDTEDSYVLIAKGKEPFR